MNRPEGISESAWEKADAVLLESPAFMIPTATYQATQVLIAKAIQSSVEAERAACALIADDFAIPDQDTEMLYRERFNSSPLDAGVELASDHIALAIRSRKGA